jgi:hypothetical protein
MAARPDIARRTASVVPPHQVTDPVQPEITGDIPKIIANEERMDATTLLREPSQ